MDTTSAWRTTRSSSVIFLFAVFFTFACLGFTGDTMGLGSGHGLRFGISILLSGLFPVAYAAAGISLKNKWSRGVIPIFVVQFVLMGLLSHWFPDPPQPAQFDKAQTARLQKRLSPGQGNQ